MSTPLRIRFVSVGDDTRRSVLEALAAAGIAAAPVDPLAPDARPDTSPEVPEVVVAGPDSSAGAVDLLRAVAENTTDAVFVKDLQGRYLLFNEAAARFVGRPAADVIGRDDTELFEPESARRIAEFDREVIAGGVAITREMPDLRAAGAVRTNLVMKAPWRDARGAVAGIIGISRDITERLALEEQVRQSQKLEAAGQIAGGIAHDFNNLLTVMDGYTDMALGEIAATDPLREPLRLIRKSVDRSRTLIRQLLAFSRRQPVAPQSLDLAFLLDELSPMLARLVGDGVELTIDAAPVAPVRADRSQLEQVLFNLAANARDAMPGGGRLAISVRGVAVSAAAARAHPDVRPGAHVVLEVSDAGQGMTPEVISRIFEPFFTTKPAGAGTGLGLAVVHGVIRQWRGFVAVESAPGRGTTFRVYLPCEAAAKARRKRGGRSSSKF